MKGPQLSSLGLTCCLFYFQTRFNVVYIYTIWAPATPLHRPWPRQVQVPMAPLPGVPWQSPVCWVGQATSTMKGSSVAFLQQEGNGAFYDKKEGSPSGSLVILDLFFLFFPQAPNRLLALFRLPSSLPQFINLFSIFMHPGSRGIV